MNEANEADFRDYVQARQASLLRDAYLWCGDWHEAQDLVQHALIQLYTRWSRLHQHQDVTAYVRKIVLNKLRDNRKSPSWSREDHAGVLPEHAAPEDFPHDSRGVLITALRGLPLDQRTVLVCRYWMDMSIDDVAALMNFSTPKVKTLAHRGCMALRGSLVREEV